MVFHRAKPSSAPVDITPGAAARLRLRPEGEADVLARAYAERDAAVEEAEYLREQLRSMQDYLTHVLELERAVMRAERDSLQGELALLEQERRSRD